MKFNNLLRQRCLPILLACGGFELMLPTAAVAVTTTNVSVGDNFFNPPSIKINVGDSVKWNWTGFSQHTSTSTSTPILWDSSPPHGNGFTFTHTFTNAGSFPYRCLVHSGQTGTIAVQASASIPPSVALTSPTNGATFAAPWTGVIQASTLDTDDTVSKVDFFAGQTLLGTVANPPANLNFIVTNLAAGSYVLNAVATDSRGGSTSSSGVTVRVVTPSAIILREPQRPSSTSFQFSYSTDPGLSYVIQRSGGLAGWSPIQTNTAASSSAIFLDDNATDDFNFYSIKLLPNP